MFTIIGGVQNKIRLEKEVYSPAMKSHSIKNTIIPQVSFLLLYKEYMLKCFGFQCSFDLVMNMVSHFIPIWFEHYWYSFTYIDMMKLPSCVLSCYLYWLFTSESSNNYTFPTSYNTWFFFWENIVVLYTGP